MKLIIDVPEETFNCLKNMVKAECVDPYSLADIIVNKSKPVDLWKMRQEATENALKKAEVMYKRPQGEWIVIYAEDNIKTCKCSICGRMEDIVDFDKFPFCHCGAQMKGGTE